MYFTIFAPSIEKPSVPMYILVVKIGRKKSMLLFGCTLGMRNTQLFMTENEFGDGDGRSDQRGRKHSG
jgi:hypothetical protein